MPKLASLPRWTFASDRGWLPGFLAAPGCSFVHGFIFFSAFYSLLFQIRGLIGPNGLLPANDFLRDVRDVLGPERLWYAPSLFWISSSDRALMIVCWIRPDRFTAAPSQCLAACFPSRVLGCISFFCERRPDFSGYQSDGMLLEAGFLSLFFAPPGIRPGLGERNPPSRASWFLLVWLCFRIYFESGVVENIGPRLGLAKPHRDGQLLPERSAPHLDRLVRPTLAALVSRRKRGPHACD